MLTSPSGRSYIGQTRQPLEKRLRQHREEGGCPLIYDAIKKYGWDNIEVTVLHEQVPVNDLLWLERHCIAIFNTYHDGYNLTPGGEISPMHTPEARAKMSATKKAQGERGELACQSPAHRASNSATTRAQGERGELWMQSDEGRAWASSYQKELVAQGKHWNQQPKFRKTISEAQKALWRDPVYHASQTEALKKRPPASAETRAKMSASQRARVARGEHHLTSPEHREKMRERMLDPAEQLKLLKGKYRKQRDNAREAGQLELMVGLYYHKEEDDGE